MTHPPIAGNVLLVFLTQLAVMLALAVVLGRLATRVGLPQVVGELCAGLLLGPTLLGHLAPGVSGWLFPAGQFDMLDGVGQLGMLLLVGVAGMRLDVALLRSQGARVGVISLTSLVVPLLLGVACGLALPATALHGSAGRTLFILFLGVALSVSSLPLIAKILAELGLLHRDIGQFTLIAAGVDDVIGWLLLSVIAAMAAGGIVTGTIGTSLLALLAVLLISAFLLRPAVGWLLRRVSRITEPSVGVAVLTTLVLACAASTQKMNLEALLGAFVCGIVIASTGAVNPAHLAVLRTMVFSVLAPIFFVEVGLRLDLTLLGRPAVALAAVVVTVTAVLGKFGGAYLGAGMIKLDRWRALAIGAGLNARGVTQIVVASVGLRSGVINTAGYTVVVLVAVVTSIMAPPLLRLALGHIAITPAEQERHLSLANAGSTTLTTGSTNH